VKFGEAKLNFLLRRTTMPKKNRLQRIKEEREKAIIVLMLLIIDDEDLERLHRDYPNWEDKKRILLAMFLNPKEKWAELGVPEYLWKYELGGY